MARKGFAESVALVSEASRGKQYFMLEDFDQRVVENKEFASSKEVAVALARNNYKHYAVAISRAQQPAVDNYLKGKISRTDLVTEMSGTNLHLKGKDIQRNGEAIVSLIENATASGMKVHFVDTLQPDSVVHDLTDGLTRNMTVGELRSKLKEGIKVCNELAQYPEANLTCDNRIEARQFQTALDLVNSVGGADNAKVSDLTGKIKSKADWQNEADKDIADYLVSRTNGEPTVIMINGGHAGYHNNRSSI